MLFALKGNVGVPNSLCYQGVPEHLGLRRRHDLVVETLQQQHRTRDTVDVRQRCALDIEVVCLRQRPDEAIEIARLKVVSVLREANQFRDAEVRGASAERVRTGEGGQSRPTTGATGER